VLLRRGLPVPPGLHVPAELQLPGEARGEAVGSAVMQPSPDPRRVALESLLSARRGEFLAYLARRAPSWVSAEDLFQQVALRALDKADTLRDPDAARAWVYTLLRRAVVDASRAREIPVEEVPDAGTDPAVHAPHHCRCTVALLDELKPEYQSALRCAAIEGDSVTAIAAGLGITPNNAAVRLHRARAALRTKLLAHCGATAATDCTDCSCDEHRCGEA